MTTLSGLLYVKHDNVGTRSEGPGYYLQTMHGDFGLQYAERHSWEVDYYLEYFDHRMVEVKGEVSPDRRVKVERINELCVQHIPQIYTEYRAKIVNASTAEIVAIHLGMVGDGEEQTVDSLQPGASTGELSFQLRQPDPSKPTMISYRDYHCRYTQLGVQKQIVIVGPKPMTTIKITNGSYQVE
ncbi:MAG: hypothetical protein U0350_50115 [Caldilineaceae bacterium]